VILCFSFKGYKFEGLAEPPPVEVDDAIRRQEEEELQRVLEMSKTDKGGRSHWVDNSSVGAGSSSAASLSTSSGAGPSGGSSSKYPSGYVPAASPALAAQAQPPPRVSSANDNRRPAGANQPTVTAEATTAIQRRPTQRASVLSGAQIAVVNPAPLNEAPSTAAQPAASVSTITPTPAQPPVPMPASRVRALHKFEPTEPGELGFEKGDVIKVVDRGYKDWWRGQLRGKTGIFPVNYVVCVCCFGMDSPLAEIVLTLGSNSRANPGGDYPRGSSGGTNFCSSRSH
jgi:signal transducing adaptor molecule